MNITSRSSSNSSWQGGIVGAVDYGMIKNCHTDYFYVTTNQDNLGGIVGGAYLSRVDSCIVSNSTFYDIRGNIIGGIVGRNRGESSSNIGRVSNSKSINNTIDVTNSSKWYSFFCVGPLKQFCLL